MSAFAHDLCLSFFGDCYARKMFEFPKDAHVLEIGCSEADWAGPMKTLRPDLTLTGIDVRDPSSKYSGTFIKGDVLIPSQFAPHTFDCIVSVSTIEHIGLGAYGDPVNPQGDLIAMANAWTWLKPGGWMYLDVPYSFSAYQCFAHKHRVYDEQALQERLLPLWKEQDRWIIEHVGSDAPYIALTLQPA